MLFPCTSHVECVALIANSPCIKRYTGSFSPKKYLKGTIFVWKGYNKLADVDPKRGCLVLKWK